VQPEYEPLLVNVKVARPALADAVCVTGVTSPPPAPVQVPESAVAVIVAVELVTRLPFTS
jgi:hypothetical protein